MYHIPMYVVQRSQIINGMKPILLFSVKYKTLTFILKLQNSTYLSFINDSIHSKFNCKHELRKNSHFSNLKIIGN